MRKTTTSISTIILFLAVIVFMGSCKKDKNINDYTQNLPQVEVNSQRIELDFKQPLDHKNPNQEKFTQRVILNHVGYDRPTVVKIEGYGLYSKERGELAKLLNANQIIIEHRFFKESKPDSLKWQYLDIWQAATDHHKIIQAFKDLYPGKWISTGISKGGQATIFHRKYYPEDVDVSVPYVAPLNFSDEDTRVYDFLDEVGTKACRQKIYTFQKQLFERKAKIMPLFREYARNKDYQFEMGIERAYDLNILEYPFAFWQWGISECHKIPGPNASNQEIFKHLVKVSDGSFFEKDGIKYNRPFFYQALTEIGMYGYEVEPFRKYLEDTTNITFEHTLPEGVTVSFDSTAMQEVQQWIQTEGNNMLYIYGEYDPWSATSVNPGEKTNAVKMVNPGGSHRTRIDSFPAYMKDSIYSVLEKWTGVEIKK
jgi:hypothetical protein